MELKKQPSHLVMFTINNDHQVVNLAGVKWVNRLQQLLMLVLSAAVLDFVVGSFFSYHRPC